MKERPQLMFKSEPAKPQGRSSGPTASATVNPRRAALYPLSHQLQDSPGDSNPGLCWMRLPRNFCDLVLQVKAA